VVVVVVVLSCCFFSICPTPAPAVVVVEVAVARRWAVLAVEAVSAAVDPNPVHHHHHPSPPPPSAAVLAVEAVSARGLSTAVDNNRARSTMSKTSPN